VNPAHDRVHFMAAENTKSFLDSLSLRERTDLLERSTTREFKTGDLLILEGSSGDSMLVIDSGTLDVNRGELTLAHVGKGAVVGEMSLLDPSVRSASVIATSKGKAYEFQRETFLAMLEAGEPTSLALLRLLTETVCTRLGKVNKMVQDEVVKPQEEGGFKGLWKRIRSAI
jgi:CRP-like cAMP-binding protein